MRAKNSKLSSPLIAKSAGNHFFKNTLKILIVIALLQLGAALLVSAPHLMTTVVKLFPRKASATTENRIPLPPPKNITTTSSHSEANKIIPKIGSSSLEGANVQPGASLNIIDIRHNHGSLGEQALKIAIKSQTQEPISIPDVKVQVYFYDQQGEEIVPSKAPVTSRWLRSPVEWKNGEPEILEVIYQPDLVTSELYYVGYIVAVYYKGELQSYRADPVKLTGQFPIKVFIGSNEL